MVVGHVGSNLTRTSFVFRTDASLKIGSGHVMRCLTLAEALRARGAECSFISCEHAGNLLDAIRQRGFAVHLLPAEPVDSAAKTLGEGDAFSYQSWLGSDWQTDAEQSKAFLAAINPDWLVVDHYALDGLWEQAVKPDCKRLLVIDDLADRAHACDVLLDQNLGRASSDYVNLLPERCIVLTGPRFALLRPEFSALREFSLQRRGQGKPGRLLITMGGVDQLNATGLVLDTLKGCPLPADCRITVVMGAKAPHLRLVQEQASLMPWPTEVLAGIGDMAQRMADNDLAIGAAGSTAWERCCLGLPTLMVVLAENQWPGAKALHAAHAAYLIGEVADVPARLPSGIAELLNHEALRRMSHEASLVCDGQGTGRLIEQMQVFT
jgi:UDP-2,4-diacetamido-2,4,6-trideoxy-beta-L-altropyranose hydrolase